MAPGRRPLAAADLGALEGRAGRARGGEQPVACRRGRSRRSCRRRRRASSARPGAAASARITPGRVGADVAGDAGQDVDARAGMGAQPELRRGRADRAGPWPARTARQPSGVGSMPRRRWCMIGLPTSASSRISARLIAGPHRERRRSARRAPCAPRRVISPAPSGCIIAYETRLIRSSPKRICGFITPSLARTAPSARFGEVAGDRRRADVDRDAVGRLVEARARPR